MIGTAKKKQKHRARRERLVIDTFRNRMFSTHMDKRNQPNTLGGMGVEGEPISNLVGGSQPMTLEGSLLIRNVAASAASLIRLG